MASWTGGMGVRVYRSRPPKTARKARVAWSHFRALHPSFAIYAMFYIRRSREWMCEYDNEDDEGYFGVRESENASRIYDEGAFSSGRLNGK